MLRKPECICVIIVLYSVDIVQYDSTLDSHGVLLLFVLLITAMLIFNLGNRYLLFIVCLLNLVVAFSCNLVLVDPFLPHLLAPHLCSDPAAVLLVSRSCHTCHISDLGLWTVAYIIATA